MHEFKGMSERVAKMRERYRTTKPRVDISRYKLVTEFYMENQQLTGILKRAKNLRNLFENMPTYIADDEVIVGNQGNSYRCSALYPETSFAWVFQEMAEGGFENRFVDPYDINKEDEEYIKQTGAFWLKNNMSAITDEYLPKKYKEDYIGNGVVLFNAFGNAQCPVGHFAANHWVATQKGFAAIRDEARAKMKELEDNGFGGDGAYKYNFYTAVEIVTEGIIIYTKRYAKAALEKAEAETNPERKKELLMMADSLNWIIENPCRTYYDALQCIFLYQMSMCLDAQQHGISFGRLDQYLGRYYEQDIANGTLTPEYAQELTDLFILKIAEQNKCISAFSTACNPGYTSGMLVTIGGVDKEGNDATNEVTYMVLESLARLQLHSPPLALRVNDQMPSKLWEAAIACTKRCGGVPTFEYDGVIIPAMMKRGVSLEDARNYCLIGCVEPSIGGYEWAQPGGTGTESYINIVNALVQAINNGTNPLKSFFPGTPDPHQTGPATGYLYEMNSIEEVCEAFKKQIDFWMPWHANCTNAWETIASFHTQLPLVSATVEGCMESGKDVQCGGAKYNSTGSSCIGIGNVADSLNVINQVCFVQKIATTRQLYDALMANWEGYEELRQKINGIVPRMGNGDPESDKFVKFVAETYANAITKCEGHRGGKYQAGCYPVTLNVAFGKMTWATPDGRKIGEPLSDGISPVQGMDKNGPVATMQSILKYDQSDFGNGTLCNMKFHPTALASDDGVQKLRSVMESYFKNGGMELQLNVVSSETLRDAQANPDKYRDLVVRVAGFSAYFVEVFKDSQDDLIRRTELNL